MLLKSQLQPSTSNQRNKLLQNKELLTMSNEEKPNNEEKSNDRPKLKSINGNNDVPTVTPKVRRIAQPGEVLFPRAVAYRTDIKPVTRLVALWLYDHLAPGTNLANGSQKLIAEELGLHKETVIKALDELWSKRVIVKIERMN